TWYNEDDEQLPIVWTAEKAVLRSAVEGWPAAGLSMTAKEVSLYTPDSLCHVIHKIWRADGNSPIARAFNAVTQPPSFQDRKVGLSDCMIALENMDNLEGLPPSGEESTVRLGSLVGDILPVHFDYFSFYAGAAHGNYATLTTHLLLPTLKEVDADALFIEGYRPALDKLVRDGLVEQFGADAGLEYKALPDDFHFEIQSGQFVVYFNPYEIGPYALGMIQVGIPYKDIHNLIREDGPLGNKK
ncbi:MAG: RsiV family protein, partial [Bacteroidia bacterium]|nr:RsiV family protein [Bacteroidia bacterium]